ncbi:hypothetical protein BGW41_007700 [Actinomortierella wolfii]|nr:hypothetical protein BGW41_007700 [Actinomortierella wolfii]
MSPSLSSPPLPPLPSEALLSPPPLSTGSTSTVVSANSTTTTYSSSPPTTLPPSSPPSSYSSSKKSRPFNISILHNKHIESVQQSPRRSSIATHLMNFASRSSTSLHLLSTSAPVQGSPAAHDVDTSKLTSSATDKSSINHTTGGNPHTTDSRPHTHQHFNTFPSRASVMPPPRGGTSAFTNPFRKLQSSFQLGSKKSMEFGSSPPASQGSNASNNSTNNISSSNSTQQQQQSQERERVLSSASSASSMISWRSKGAEMLSKKPWGRARKNSEPTFGKGTAADAGLPIFGASLEDAIRRSHIPGTPMVPAILYRCAEFLEAKGVDEVGLYRVPGSHASVQKLKRLFDTGADHNLLAMDHLDPNDIATLLKLYLRELPSPLLPAVILEQIQSILTTDRHICHTLRGILIRLPRNNYVVLSFLCHHLSRIANHAHKTKMSISNLGVVFAPTLSIGSVLFKALLGGFYDAADTPESREKGLKIVWGGLLQDFEYGFVDDASTDSGDGSAMTDGGASSSLSTPAEAYAAEIVNAQAAAGSKQELDEEAGEEVVPLVGPEATKPRAQPLFILGGVPAMTITNAPTAPPPLMASSLPPARDLYTHPELIRSATPSSGSLHQQYQQQQQQQQLMMQQHQQPLMPISISTTTTSSPMTSSAASPAAIAFGSAEDEEARLMKSMLLAEAAAAAAADKGNKDNDDDDDEDEDGQKKNGVQDDLETAVVSTATAVPVMMGGSMATVVTTTANVVDNGPTTAAGGAVSGLTQALAAAAAAAGSAPKTPPFSPAITAQSPAIAVTTTTMSVTTATESAMPFDSSKPSSKAEAMTGGSKGSSKEGSARNSIDSKHATTSQQQDKPPLLLGEFFFETEERQLMQTATATTTTTTATTTTVVGGDKEEVVVSTCSSTSSTPLCSTSTAITTPPTSSTLSTVSDAPQLPPIKRLSIAL